MNTEARLHNLEVAFMAYYSLTVDLLPPDWQESVGQMMEDYFEASEKHGGFKKGEAFK